MGLFSILNDSFVTGFLHIGQYEVVVLLGIGLGAANLKELVND